MFIALIASESDAVLFGTQQRLRAFPHITSINIAGSCCTSLWYSHYTRHQPWPDHESAATRQ